MLVRLHIINAIVRSQLLKKQPFCSPSDVASILQISWIAVQETICDVQNLETQWFVRQVGANGVCEYKGDETER